MTLDNNKIIYGHDQASGGAMPPNGTPAEPSEPTAITARANAKVSEELPLDDQQDFEDARRGLIASEPELLIKGPKGRVVWDQTAFGFIAGHAPPSVNPSLWRQAKLNSIHGLFKVAEGIFQIRGYDISNLTIIQGRTGWIVVDPLTTRETAAAALAFAQKHLPARPITALIFTHSHVDHFGGVLGIVSPEDSKNGQFRIIAPEGFMEESVSENVIAGPAMSRRAQYMYGKKLPCSERGHVDNGLGKATPNGSPGILPPTDLVTRTPQEMEIDGIRFVFQNVPESEAPAEMTFYLPDLKAFCGAEIVSRNMHNLYTLRGAKVRDALKWSNYINEAIHLFGGMEIYFATHHWPMWGNQRIMEFLKKQRDIYKYIHDQTLRLANDGYTPREIAEQMDYPEALRNTFSNRGYYGTLQHNAKAVYQFYFGWYDGNPAHLNPLPPAESGARYVEFMGGADQVLNRAEACFNQGDYRWTAEVLNHLVFAQPENQIAKALLARTYDQLGYQSEAGPWRDIYLTAAHELRHQGSEKKSLRSMPLDMLKHTPVSRFLDAMAARLNGPKADGLRLTINLVFTDLQESHVLELENAVLHHRQADPDPKANAGLRLTQEVYLRLSTGLTNINEAATSGDLIIDGNLADLVTFFSLFEPTAGDFNIVTP